MAVALSQQRPARLLVHGFKFDRASAGAASEQQGKRNIADAIWPRELEVAGVVDNDFAGSFVEERVIKNKPVWNCGCVTYRECALLPVRSGLLDTFKDHEPGRGLDFCRTGHWDRAANAFGAF